MFGRETILNKTPEAGGCTNTVDLYNPFPDGGGVALYQLNGNATDESGNYNGTATNVTYGTGHFGQAGVFNGSSSYVLIPDSPALRLTGDYTISFWFKTNSIGANQRLINKDNANDFSGGYALLIESNGTMTWGHNDGSTNQNWNIGVSISANTWYYVTAVYSNNSNLRSFYLNNVLQATRTTNTNIASETDVLLFGAYGQSSPLGQYFNGSIDQVRIFNRALRPYEIEALYTEEYCTPTIVPSEHFNTVTYTGTGTNQQVTGIGFEPDFVWIKSRTTTNPNVLHDTVRGIGNVLYSNLTNAEADESLYFTGVGDGFLQFGVNAGNYNNTGTNYVAWNFKAGGDAVENTDGTITSQVSANTEAGFSIVKYNLSSPSASDTIGHGLGVAPSVIITKGTSDVIEWYTYHKDVGTGKYLRLENTAAAVSYANGFSTVNDTVWQEYFTAQPFEKIAYCFAEVEGFSNFGSYAGTGASGNTIVTGFEPAFVMIKRTDSTGNWFILDNKRDNTNPNNLFLLANASDNEKDLQVTDALDFVNFLENGFEVLNGGTFCNASGASYVYMAFAADPTAVEPSLEDSFNTVTYTGNGGTQTIGGVFEGGASFNGSSYIQASAGYPSTLGNITVSGWFNFSNTNNGWVGNNSGSLFSLGQSTTNVAGNNLCIRLAENSTTFNLQSFNNDSSITMNTASPSIDTWFHIALTYETSTNKFKVYLNGAYQGESAALTYNFQTTAFRIGSGVQGGGTFHFQGLSDQVRIFNTALTAAQVTELYEETDADSSVCNFPSGAGAIALYELNGNANDTCGTYNGTATSVTWLNNGVGFQPDLVWLKGRNTTQWHGLYDSIRGVSKWITSNATNAEADTAGTTITSFNTNGFSLGNDINGYGANTNTNTYVAWCWKGAEIPAINSNGSITSVVSANPAAGFSISTYSGKTGGGTTGHGLNSEPEFIIFKRYTAAQNWFVFAKINNVWHSFEGLNTNAAAINYSAYFSANDSIINWYNANEYNSDPASSYLAYSFNSVAGFSKFGSYAGNGSTNIITTGFEPAFVIIKAYTSADNWVIIDNKRGVDNRLYADLTNAEGALANRITFDANGFTLTTSAYNANGFGFIYMAFANQF